MTTPTKPIITHPCPGCGKELNCEEIDIGVGTLMGNFRCPNCGWIPKDIEELFSNSSTKECKK